jgi:hypothetical protein
MNKKEQDEVRKRLIDCIDSGNFEVATPEQQAKTGDSIDWQLIADMEDERCPRCGCVESGCWEVGCMSEEWEDEDV